jgi:hypothetical protein
MYKHETIINSHGHSYVMIGQSDTRETNLLKLVRKVLRKIKISSKLILFFTLRLREKKDFSHDVTLDNCKGPRKYTTYATKNTMKFYLNTVKF